MLVYSRLSTAANAMPRSSLVWVDRIGANDPLPLAAALYDYPRVAPDGNRIAFNMLQGNNDRSVWIYDLPRDALSRVTFGASNNWPVWSTDGKRLFYAK